jgi:hypothetical protein
MCMLWLQVLDRHVRGGGDEPLQPRAEGPTSGRQVSQQPVQAQRCQRNKVGTSTKQRSGRGVFLISQVLMADFLVIFSLQR